MLAHVQGHAWPTGRAGAEPSAQVPGTNSKLSGKEMCRSGDNASTILPPQQVERWMAFRVGNPSAVFHGFTYKGCSQLGEVTRGVAGSTQPRHSAHGCPRLGSLRLKHVPRFLIEVSGKVELGIQIFPHLETTFARTNIFYVPEGKHMHRKDSKWEGEKEKGNNHIF